MGNGILRRRLSRAAAVVAVGAAIGCSAGGNDESAGDDAEVSGSSTAASSSSTGSGHGSSSRSAGSSLTGTSGSSSEGTSVSSTSSGSSEGTSVSSTTNSSSSIAEAGTGSDDATTLDASVSDSAASDATVGDALVGDATTNDSAAQDALANADGGASTIDADSDGDTPDAGPDLDGSAGSEAATDSAVADSSNADGPNADGADGNGAFSANYTFDTTTQGWSIVGTSDPTLSGTTLAWTGTIGDPLPGALELTIPFSTANQNVTLGLPGLTGINLTGRVITVQLYLVSGLSNDPSNWGAFQVFAQSGPPSWSWHGDGSWRGLDSAPTGNSGQWITSSVDLGAAAASDPTFDPTNIVAWGIQILGGWSTTPGAISPAVVYVDSVTVQ